MLFFCVKARFLQCRDCVSPAGGAAFGHFQAASSSTARKNCCKKRRKQGASFACLVCLHFYPGFRTGFQGAKKGLRYFKIQGTYFKKQGTYFFFAPTWGLRTENQFSIFRTGKRRFSTPVLLPRMSVSASGERAGKITDGTAAGALSAAGCMPLRAERKKID